MSMFSRLLLPLLPLLALLAATTPAEGARLLGGLRGAIRRLGEVASLHVNIVTHKQHHQVTLPAPGLPNECLTYEQRYKHQYHTGLSHSSEANAQHPHSKYVVLLQLHPVFKDRVPLDMVLHIRAMAAEVTAAGYHFYILFQPPVENGYNFDSEEMALTREEVFDFLPPDLRPFAIVHNFDDDYKVYPMLAQHDDPSIPLYKTWGPGPRANYVAMTRFMQRYKAYQYAWVVEYDVRWMGSSWGDLLNAALDLGRQATEEELEAQPERLVDMSRTASRELPKSTEGLPDLLVMGPVEPSNKWKNSLNNMGGSDLFDVPAMVYMGSRRLWDALHENSLRGIGAHLEAALPTTAVKAGLKAVGLQLPHNSTYEGYYHCCLEDAGALYAAWHNASSNACAPSLLIHPVKTLEPFWPSLIFD